MTTASPTRCYSGHCKAAVQRKRNTHKELEMKSGERTVDGRLQVQLEEDGGGSTRQSWMKTGGLWTTIHWE